MSHESVSQSAKRTWERRLDEAKKKHRPKLANWSRDGFAFNRFPEFLQLRRLDPVAARSSKFVDKISCRDVNKSKFVQLYEKPNIPCLIVDVPEVEHWNAHEGWSVDQLYSRFKDRYFKVGEDDDGYKVKARFKYFVKYMENNKDDSPLYIFDGNFDGDDVSKSMLADYHVPSFFTDDLFSLVGEKKRPPYRWVLVGPCRSGSTVHIDPLATSAWNTLLVGRKRWVMFPPDTPKSIAKGLDVIKKGEDDEAVNYFVDMLPRIREKHGATLQIIECIQEPGETIFVPGGWWHGVLNLEDTIAVTQNFCSYTNFDKVWKATRKGRPKMSVRWLKQLDIYHPTLSARAVQLNVEDDFQMYDKATHVSKKDRKRMKEEAKKAQALEEKTATVIAPSQSMDAERKKGGPMGSSSSSSRNRNDSDSDSSDSDSDSSGSSTSSSSGAEGSFVDNFQGQTQQGGRAATASSNFLNNMAESRRDSSTTNTTATYEGGGGSRSRSDSESDSSEDEKARIKKEEKKAKKAAAAAAAAKTQLSTAMSEERKSSSGTTTAATLSASSSSNSLAKSMSKVKILPHSDDGADGEGEEERAQRSRKHSSGSSKKRCLEKEDSEGVANKEELICGHSEEKDSKSGKNKKKKCIMS